MMIDWDSPSAGADLQLADLTDRTVLGDFGVTAAHSAGSDYAPSQERAANLFDAGFDRVRYRVRHDPAMVRSGGRLRRTGGDAEPVLGPQDRPYPALVDR